MQIMDIFLLVSVDGDRKIAYVKLRLRTELHKFPDKVLSSLDLKNKQLGLAGLFTGGKY